MPKFKSTTAIAAVEAMKAAADGPLLPPAHVKLRDGDLDFWHSIVRARARKEWSENDLVVAAQLARTQADIEREQKLLDDEGTVVENQRGTQVMNPRVTVLEQLARREMALMRSLKMGGSHSGPDARDVQKLRQLERDASAARDEVLADDLLAE